MKYKILIVGNGSSNDPRWKKEPVGSTSLMTRFTREEASQTNGENPWCYETQTVVLDYNKQVQTIVGSRGTPTDHEWCMAQHHYRGVHGVILLYRIDCRTSFEDIHNWLGEVKENCPPNTQIILVGNAYDLGVQREVEYAEATEYAKTIGLPYMEVSAKTGHNVELLFKTLNQMIHDQYLFEKTPEFNILEEERKKKMEKDKEDWKTQEERRKKIILYKRIAKNVILVIAAIFCGWFVKSRVDKDPLILLFVVMLVLLTTALSSFIYRKN